jgi:hypothetical protein
MMADEQPGDLEDSIAFSSTILFANGKNPG